MNRNRELGFRSGRTLLVATFLWLMSAGATYSVAQQPETAPPVASSTSADTLPPVPTFAVPMLDTLQATVDSVALLQSIEFTDPDADVEFLRVLVIEQFALWQHALETIAARLGEAGPGGPAAASLRTVLRGYVTQHVELIEGGLDYLARDYEGLRRRRAGVTPEELGTLESGIRSTRTWSDSLIRYEALALETSDDLRLGLEERWDGFEHRLHNIAETLTGRLHLAAAEREDLQDRIDLEEGADSPESEIAELRLQLAALETRVEGIAGTMSTVIEVLNGRGYDTAAYEEVLIRTTGEVTGEILDQGVLARLVRDFAADTWQFLRHNAGTAFVRAFIVIFFIILFRVTFAVLWRVAVALRPSRGSRLVRDLVERTLRPLAFLVGLIAGLTFIGVQTTTLLAGLGIAGLVVGFALQDSISNLFAGFAILANRPYDLDDIVEVAGVIGTVRAMGLWTTTVMRFDGRRLLVPNRNIWGSSIENWSVEKRRRVECVARVGYEADLQRVLELLEKMLKDEPRVLADPAPHVWVSELHESWVEVKVWGWVKSEDWWSLHSDLRRLVRLKLEEEGIEMPSRRYRRIDATGSESSDEFRTGLPEAP